MNQRRGQFTGVVCANIPLCREHFKLVMEVRGFPPTKAGQFVQLLCRSTRDLDYVERELEWPSPQRPEVENVDLIAPTALLRRPFSLAGATTDGETATIEVIHRVVGVGTDWLVQLRTGDEVGIL